MTMDEPAPVPVPAMARSSQYIALRNRPVASFRVSLSRFSAKLAA